METAILKVILPNAIEERYRPKGDFSINNHWNLTLSTSHINLHELRNLLLLLKWHKSTRRFEGTGLGSWVGGPKIPPKGPKYSKIIAY